MTRAGSTPSGIATATPLAELATVGAVIHGSFTGMVSEWFPSHGPGRQASRAANTDLAEIAWNVSLDGAGVAGRRTGVTCLSCPPPVENRVRRFAESRDWTFMPPWFESDHAIFAMRGIPAVAITSEDVRDLFTSVAHTPEDTLELVHVDTLVQLVEALHHLLPEMSRTLRSTAAQRHCPQRGAQARQRPLAPSTVGGGAPTTPQRPTGARLQIA